jgi:hypothetical protein
MEAGMNEADKELGLIAGALVVVVVVILIGLLYLGYSLGRLIWG